MSRLLIAAAAKKRQVAPPTTADYVATNDSELASILALGSGLDGKVVELNGTFNNRMSLTGNRTLPNGLTIRGANPGQAMIPGFYTSGTNPNITLDGIYMQVRGWPGNNDCFETGSGVMDNWTIKNCIFRHGYGPNQLDFITDFQYPEYNRLSHVVTAGAASVRTALTWMDTGLGGWIECFNRGNAPAYVKVGNDPNIVATTADILMPPNSNVRIEQGVVSHAAAICPTGTVDINFRTEIGISAYLNDAFFVTGGALFTNTKLIGNTFLDLSNAIKASLWGGGTCISMDNVCRRIYQDTGSYPYGNNGFSELYILRNLMEVPFNRQAVPENLVGDARNPHGDLGQMFKTFGPAAKNVYSAGNRSLPTKLRPTAGSQGNFWSDNSMGYEDVYSICDMMLGGAGNGMTIDPSARYAYVYADTILGWESMDQTSNIKIYAGAGTNSYVGRCLASSAQGSSQGYVALEDNYIVPRTANADLIFADWPSRLTASNRQQIEAAMTGLGPLAGKGAADLNYVIDWDTTDYSQVIKWDQLPAGIRYLDQKTLNPNTVYTTPIHKVLGGPPTMTISVDAGCEYQITSDQAGATIVQAWTSASGTINRGQFLQMRRTTSSSNMTRVDLGYTLNGFRSTTFLETKAADPAVFWTSNTSGPAFMDPANTMSGNNGEYTIYFKLKPASLGATRTLANMGGNQLTLEVLSGGSIRLGLRDSAGTAMLSAVGIAPTGALAVGIWAEIIFTVSLISQKVKMWINGDQVTDKDIVPGASAFQGRAINLLQATTGANRWDGNVSSLKFWKNTYTSDGSIPAATPYKTIEGNAATINADPWKVGADAT